MSPVAAQLAAVGSAVLFGVASAMQHYQVRAVARRGSLDARLLYDLARRGTWWVSVLADGGAVVLQALALHRASVAFVQGVLVLGLPVSVLLTTPRGRVGLRAVVGTCLATAGIGVFAAVQPQDQPVPASTRGLLLPVAVVVVASLWSRRAPTVLVGAAAGVVTGAASALLAAAAVYSFPGVLGRPAAWLALGAGLLALQLGQSALRGHNPGSALAALTLAEPVTAVALAALVLHQHPALTPLAVLGAVAGAVGVVVLETGGRTAPVSDD